MAAPLQNSIIARYKQKTAMEYVYFMDQDNVKECVGISKQELMDICGSNTQIVWASLYKGKNIIIMCGAPAVFFETHL